MKLRVYRRRVLVALGVPAACVLLTSCTPRYTPLAIDEQDGGIVAVWRGCSAARHHGIEELGLYRSDSNVDTSKVRPIWKIHAATGTRASAVRLGQAPPGFVTDTPLRQQLSPTDILTLIANDDSEDVWAYVTFRPEMLKPGVVVFDDETVKTTAQYEKIPHSYFGC